MEHFTFYPEGVCSKQIDFDIDDAGRIHNLKFVRGCNGNLKALGILLEGRDAKEIADTLSGNLCGSLGTSCMARLSEFLYVALDKKEI